ncbi:hypothetical protein CLOP_g24512, partial [Closterium sp. NIES-67]
LKRLSREVVQLQRRVKEPGWLVKKVKDVGTEIEEMTQQRNGLRQQLRNTQEHRGRLRQQLMEIQDKSLKVLRDCLGDLSRVPAEGVPQLVSAISSHIQPVLEQEEEDLVEVNPEPKLGEVMRLLGDTIRALLAAAIRR